MATDTIDGLESLLGGLALSTTPTIPGADILHNPVDIYRAFLADLLVNLVHCDPKVAFEAISPSNEISNGDVMIVLPRLKLQAQGVNQKELGFDLIKQVGDLEAGKFPSSPLFTLPFVDGVSLRVFFSTKTLPRLLLPYIADRGPSYGADPALGHSDLSSAPKKLLIDFSSPNLAKEFTAGHLRSTILGSHLAALHECMGWQVSRVNFLGDWGKHIGLLAAGWTRFGSEDSLASDPLRHLLDVFTRIEAEFKKESASRPKGREDSSDAAEVEKRQAEFDAQGLHGERDALFKKLEDGDPEAVALWQRFRDLSITEYTKLYARLGVSFDEYAGESQVSSTSIAKVEEGLRAAGVYEEDHDAWKVDFKKHGVKSGQRGILRFRNGTTTYLLRDIAAVLDREEKYDFDRMLYIVEAQDTHFQCVFKALELMGRGDLVPKLQHITFLKGADMPLVADGDGEAPAHRHAQLLSDFLDSARGAAHGLLTVDVGKAAPLGNVDAAADRLGVAALIVQNLHLRPRAAAALDLTQAATFEGETGPALHFWHARLCALLRSAAGPAQPDYAAVDGEDYADLLRLLAQWPEVAKAATRSAEPHGLLVYLFRLVEELGASLGVEIEEEAEIDANENLVYNAVRQVLENGMRVLGMPVIASL